MKVRGRVVAGDRRGTTLGYPTANIPLPAGLAGVYAGIVTVPDAEHAAALFADPARGILEAHLLDFSGDLYGSDIEIEVLEKIRDGAAFATDEELRRAIAADVVAVRAKIQS